MLCVLLAVLNQIGASLDCTVIAPKTQRERKRVILMSVEREFWKEMEISFFGFCFFFCFLGILERRTLTVDEEFLHGRVGGPFHKDSFVGVGPPPRADSTRGNYTPISLKTM